MSIGTSFKPAAPVAMSPATIADGELVCHTSLRGIAACCVVGYHAVLAHGAPDYAVARSFFAHGYLFVDMFFLLSGYIIRLRYGPAFSGPRLQGHAWGDFLLRRVIRIYPTYLVWLLAAVAVAAAVEWKDAGVVRVSPEDLWSFVMHLGMVQSLLDAAVKWNVPLWSIGVEMISYAIFPILVLAQTRLRLFDALAAVVALVGLASISATVSLDTTVGWTSLLRCLLGFTLGMVLVSARRAVDALPDAWLSALQLSAAAFAVAAVAGGAEMAAVLAFALMILLTGVNRGVLWSVLRSAAPHHLGRISYSIYLAHIPVLGLYLASAGYVEDRFGAPMMSDWLLMTAFVLAGSVAAAAVSFDLVETRSRIWLTARLLR